MLIAGISLLGVWLLVCLTGMILSFHGYGGPFDRPWIFIWPPIYLVGLTLATIGLFRR